MKRSFKVTCVDHTSDVDEVFVTLTPVREGEGDSIHVCFPYKQAKDLKLGDIFELSLKAR